jgi:hypothetical protein
MWVPPELKDPVLIHAPTRKSIACFGAVSLASGKCVRSLCEKFDARRFGAFLDELLAAVDTCFDRWRKPNSMLRRPCGII